MSWSVQRKRLRAVLAGERCVTMATVYDPITARLAELLGFETGLMGGSVVSYAALGVPDLILITLTELAEQVHRCARVSSVPLVIDGDHGYGNALNVMRTVQEMDYAGAAAIAIEDTLQPRPYGPSDETVLIPFAEAVAKVKAAVAARGDSDLLVLGRSHAAGIAGIDEAVARFKAFEAAGVDAIFVPMAQERRIIEAVSAAVALPLLTPGLPVPLCDPAWLAGQRVKAWAAGHHTFAVGVQALHDAMKAVRDGTVSSLLPDQASKELLARSIGAADHERWTREFMGGAQARATRTHIDGKSP